MNTGLAKKILGGHLTEQQLCRAIKSAASDAMHWKQEASLGTLPKISDMNLDWDIDADLLDAGCNAYAMQQLSFAIAIK